MNNDISISTKPIDISLKEIQKISIQIECTYQNEILSTISNIKRILQKVKEVIDRLICDIHKTIQSFRLLELSMPDLSVPINNFDYVPQGPPLKENSIKEMAIENFKYNMQRYKNSKLILKIREKFPAFIEMLIFDILKYLIFKALGMQ